MHQELSLPHHILCENDRSVGKVTYDLCVFNQGTPSIGDALLDGKIALSFSSPSFPSALQLTVCDSMGLGQGLETNTTFWLSFFLDEGGGMSLFLGGSFHN